MLAWYGSAGRRDPGWAGLAPCSRFSSFDRKSVPFFRPKATQQKTQKKGLFIPYPFSISLLSHLFFTSDVHRACSSLVHLLFSSALVLDLLACLPSLPFPVIFSCFSQGLLIDLSEADSHSLNFEVTVELPRPSLHDAQERVQREHHSTHTGHPATRLPSWRRPPMPLQRASTPKLTSGSGMSLLPMALMCPKRWPPSWTKRASKRYARLSRALDGV